MLVSAFISVLRRRYNDLPVKHVDKKTGDGSSLNYKTMFSPIKEGSFSLFFGTSAQVSGYSIDYDTGDIVLTSGTATVIKAEYQEVKYRDQHWLEAIQSSFDSLGYEFFKTVVGDTSAMAISADVQKYACPTYCIKMTKVLESNDYTSAGNWVKPSINTRYDRSTNSLVLSAKPTKANYLLISYIKSLFRPTSLTSILDVEDPWFELLELKGGSHYHRSMASRIAQQGNATVEEGHLAMAQLRAMANDLEVLYTNLKKKLKPVMPASEIPYYIHGGGDTF